MVLRAPASSLNGRPGPSPHNRKEKKSVLDTIRPPMMPMEARHGPPATGRGHDYAELSREEKQTASIEHDAGIT